MGDPKIKERGKATQFKPGVSPNPGGKPVASRNKLQGDFMRELAADFEAHGKAAIQKTRETQPAQYLKVVASLMPKELEIKRPLEDLTEDELIAGVAALQSFLGANGAKAGAGDQAVAEQAKPVSPLH